MARILTPATCLLILISLALCTAQAVPSVDISVDDVFYYGDTIEFSFMILSQEDETIYIVPGIFCNESPQALLEVEEVTLVSGQPYFGEYVHGEVTDIYSTEECEAFVTMNEPYYTTASRAFSIETIDSFEFLVNICKDAGCAEKGKTFAQGEAIYLDYSSDAEGLSITASLTYPDNQVEDITLPKSITATQIGTYKVDVTAEKDGYRTVTLSEQFGFIESGAADDIEIETFCNSDGTCDPEEDFYSCPEDCIEHVVISDDSVIGAQDHQFEDEISGTPEFRPIPDYLFITIIGFLLLIAVIGIMTIPRLRNRSR